MDCAPASHHGPDCDGQFLFACDLLGTNSGHYPRHSKTYGRLLEEATKALTQYSQEVRDGTYPAKEHTTANKDPDARFTDELNKRGH